MKGDTKGQGFATRAIHAGQEPDPVTGSVAVPIYQTSTYIQDELGQTRGGHEYARVQNPTRRALEKLVASLEGGLDGHAYASGMSAVNTLMTLLETGDHAVVSQNVYGGTFRLFEQVLTRSGLTFSWVDTGDLDAVRGALTAKTRMIYVETPTNPLMEISDIAAVAEIAREADCVLVVDNTFLSPYHQRPLELGADVVIHSTTKYLNGHSDSVGGVLVSNRQEHADWFHFVSKSAGAILSPFDSFLVMRGIKTLPVRMARHEENARRVVDFLTGREGIERVLYPGLPDHPGYEVQKRQSRGFGAMVTIDLGSYEAAKRLLDGVRVFSLAESLGGVESLISHPATMTHASVPAERRKRLGIGEGMVRLSVGIEEADDLVADLDRALAG
jgi:cystathionine beta-lyase/cystathionine gamma-synthase